MKDEYPFVSIMVIVRNEEATIVKSIESLLNLDYPHFEIILVDGFSTDTTYEKVLKQFKNESKLKLFQLESNIPKARNYAIKKSKGDIIACIDGDIVVKKTWLKSLVDSLVKNADSAAVGGSYIPIHTVNNLYVNVADLLRTTFIGSGGDTTTYDIGDQNEIKGALAGCNCAFYKTIFEQLNGYDESLIGCEDVDFIFRIRKQGKKIRYVSNATVEHYVKYNSLIEYLKFIWKYGKIRGIAVKKHRYLLTKTQVIAILFNTVIIASLSFWAITGNPWLITGLTILYLISLFGINLSLAIKMKSLKLAILGFPISLLQNLSYNFSFFIGLLGGKQKEWNISKK